MEQGIGYLDELVQYDEELSDSLAERFVKYGFKAPDPALARQLLMKLKAQVYYGLPEDGAASIQEYVAAIHKLAERMVFLLHVFLQGDDAQPEQLENLRAKLPADCQTLASRNREAAAKELEQLLAEEGIRIADLLAKPEEKARQFAPLVDRFLYEAAGALVQDASADARELLTFFYDEAQIFTEFLAIYIFGLMGKPVPRKTPDVMSAEGLLEWLGRLK